MTRRETICWVFSLLLVTVVSWGDDPPSAVQKAQIVAVPSKLDGIEVEIAGTEGVVLAGTFLVPQTASSTNRAPGVVFITGSGLQDRDETIFGKKPFRVLANALFDVGVASVRCDDRGFGASKGDPSTATTLDFLADARAQVAWLRSRPEIDPARVGIVGHSEGGLIGTLMAQDPDPAMNFGVLLAPPGISGGEVLIGQTADIYAQMRIAPADAAFVVECHREMIAAVAPSVHEVVLREKMTQLVRAQWACIMKTKPSEEMVASSVQLGMKQIDSPWMRAFIPLDPGPAIARSGVPLLVLFGDRDLQVAPKRNAAPFQRAASDYPVAPEVVIVAGANHLFQPARTGMMDEYATIKVEMDPAVPKMIVEWVVGVTAKMPVGRSAPVSPKSSP